MSTVSHIPSSSAPNSPPERGRLRIRPWIRALVVVSIAFFLGVKILGYVSPGTASVEGVRSGYSEIHSRIDSYVRDAGYLHDCPSGQSKRAIPGGWVCVAGNTRDTVYNRIFETYPAGPDGKNYVYTSTTSGSMEVAKGLLAGVVHMPRYAPVHVGRAPTWREDPYHAVYWRLNYYALRPTQSLLSAFIQTGDPVYARRLVALDKSFFAQKASALAWQEPHAVAFRAMILVNQWWRLRQYHQLSEAESTLYLRELERTGQYLADANHYEPGYNHGTNEAAALFDLALNFPALPHAGQWLALARQRLAQSMDDLVDGNGALVENSPYYHFYTLDKYQQILNFADRFDYVIAPNFRARLAEMVDYATYILQPDSSVPLLGASLHSVVHKHGSFVQMANAHPSFEYVLTQGARGKQPPKTSVFLSHTGQTIMRSGWGKGVKFEKQSFLTMNVGSYRTLHSHFDILGITLFGNGTQLLSDAGLYTYTPGKMRAYFRGTAAHNTVVVDGIDQAQGSAAPGRFVQKDGVTYQTGASQLYFGVTHRRMTMMIDRTHFLVVDRLSSKTPHQYRQMFHLAPGAKVSRSGLTITGQGAEKDASITIRQLDPRGITASVVTGRRKPLMGLCSLQYEKAVACPAIAYESNGDDARFTTLLTIGPPDPGYRVSYDPENTGRVTIRDHGRTLVIRLSETEAVKTIARATHPTPPKRAGVELLPHSAMGLPDSGWRTGAGTLAAPVHSHGKLALRLIAEPTAQASLVNERIRADLSRRNLAVMMRVTAPANLGELEIQLSNDHWQTTISQTLENGYPARYAGEWLQLSLGRSLPSRVGKGWALSGSRPFDWTRIDGVRFVIESSPGRKPLPALEVASISSTPRQAQGAVVFVFDDGYTSILSAARYMHHARMPGNVAVIGKYVELPSQGHLTVHDLKRLQNAWGWNMVNHTQSHVDAVEDYWPKRRLGAYEEDLVGGAQFLERAGLNSAPNWLIYPHGTTNAGLGTVVRRFYKFARTVNQGPEAYPFGDPLRVKTLELGNATDSEGGGGVTTNPQEVLDAVRDAKRYHTTLILTFHRIHARASDRPGYPIGPFRKIVDGIERSGIAVTTLSGLDAMLGVPEDNRIVVRQGKSSQIRVQVNESSSGGGPISWFTGLF